MISGYLGSRDTFDRAVAYADQNEANLPSSSTQSVEEELKSIKNNRSFTLM